MTDDLVPMPLFLDLRRSHEKHHELGFPPLGPCWFVEVTLLGAGYWQEWNEDLATLIDLLAWEVGSWIADGKVLAEDPNNPSLVPVLVPIKLEVREGHHTQDFACQWYLRGDRDHYPSIAAAVTDAGVILPATISAWREHRSRSTHHPHSG